MLQKRQKRITTSGPNSARSPQLADLEILKCQFNFLLRISPTYLAQFQPLIDRYQAIADLEAADSADIDGDRPV
jgi:hypothetical protein